MVSKAQRHYRYGRGAVSGRIPLSPRLGLLWAVAVIAAVVMSSYLLA